MAKRGIQLLIQMNNVPAENAKTKAKLPGTWIEKQVNHRPGV
jgi:hypothetical protein